MFYEPAEMSSVFNGLKEWDNLRKLKEDTLLVFGKF